MSRSERLSTEGAGSDPLSLPLLPEPSGRTVRPRLVAPRPAVQPALPFGALVDDVRLVVFTPAEVSELVARVLGQDEEVASAYVAGFLSRGVSVESIYLDLLTPAARELGELWSDDSCDFFDVTVGLGRLQRVVREMSHLFTGHAGGAAGARVLLSCIPGEQHTLGLFIVSEFFVRDGWEVTLGAPISDCDVAAVVRDEWFDVVGFSVACNSRLSYLTREIPRLRQQSCNPNVAVLVGGRVFNDRPELVARVRADASAVDARSAALLARRLIGAAFEARPT